MYSRSWPPELNREKIPHFPTIFSFIIPQKYPAVNDLFGYSGQRHLLFARQNFLKIKDFWKQCLAPFDKFLSRNLVPGTSALSLLMKNERLIMNI
jgi:hypothetical protein